MVKKLSVFLCILGVVLGLNGTATAYTFVSNIYDAGPYGHDYLIYLYENENKGWNAINDLLAGSDWYLATITSQEEQDTIANFISDSEALGEFWLGGFQYPSNEQNPSAGWEWVTAEAWDYTNWNAGEPNDNYGPASEQWLAMWGSNWNWNDESNLNNITGFVLERGAPVPEPSSILLLGLGLFGIASVNRRKFKK